MTGTAIEAELTMSRATAREGRRMDKVGQVRSIGLRTDSSARQEAQLPPWIPLGSSIKTPMASPGRGNQPSARRVLKAAILMALASSRS